MTETFKVTRNDNTHFWFNVSEDIASETANLLKDCGDVKAGHHQNIAVTMEEFGDDAAWELPCCDSMAEVDMLLADHL